MLVRTLLDQKPRQVITADPTMSLENAMDLLISKNIGCLPVVKHDGMLVGIISDKDIFRRIHQTRGKYHDLTVEDVMSTDLIVGLPSDEVSYIAGIMDKNWIRHVPIIEGEEIVGLVSQRDIVKFETASHQIENRYLNLYMDSLHRRDKSGDL